MATILDAAEYILEKTEDSMPYLKLERLCYYAQAWSMAWDEEPIFPEEFYAGEKGAVCYELFDGVGHQLFVSLADSTGNSDALTVDQKDTIDSVLDYYYEYAAKSSATSFGLISLGEAPANGWYKIGISAVLSPKKV